MKIHWVFQASQSILCLLPHLTLLISNPAYQRLTPDSFKIKMSGAHENAASLVMLLKHTHKIERDLQKLITGRTQDTLGQVSVSGCTCIACGKMPEGSFGGMEIHFPWQFHRPMTPPHPRTRYYLARRLHQRIRSVRLEDETLLISPILPTQSSAPTHLSIMHRRNRVTPYLTGSQSWHNLA